MSWRHVGSSRNLIYNQQGPIILRTAIEGKCFDILTCTTRKQQTRALSTEKPKVILHFYLGFLAESMLGPVDFQSTRLWKVCTVAVQ